MKKIITAIAIGTMLATPALADRGYRGDRYHNNHRYEHREHRHRNNDAWVAALLGGIIIGAVVSSEKQKYRQPVTVCEDILHYDHYGNRYYERVCRQQ